jgi:signal transduction histidine kinase
MGNIESFENRSNGKASGTQLVTQSCLTQESQQPSLQSMERTERLALLGTSAVVFAHELGNPLQAIFISLECLENDFKSKQIADPFVMSMMRAALNEIDRLRSLLREFRSLANPQILHLQCSDLTKIVEEVLALQKLGHQAAGIAVKLEYEKPLKAGRQWFGTSPRAADSFGA